MFEPIVFISRSRIKSGKLDAFREYFQRGTDQLRADKPRTLVFLAYLSDDGTEATIVHAFADADSMDLHMEGVEERAKAAYEFLETRAFEIYGRPSERVLQMMGQAAGSGVALTVHQDHLGGFLRPGAG